MNNKVVDKMVTRQIFVNVGGLWRTSVELKEDTKWWSAKQKIAEKTGIPEYYQKLASVDITNFDTNFNKCELTEGEEVYCDYELGNKLHPLHFAAASGNIEAIQSWVAIGADINVKDKQGRTPLMHACRYLNEESIINLLRNNVVCNAVANNIIA